MMVSQVYQEIEDCYNRYQYRINDSSSATASKISAAAGEEERVDVEGGAHPPCAGWPAVGRLWPDGLQRKILLIAYYSRCNRSQARNSRNENVMKFHILDLGVPVSLLLIMSLFPSDLTSHLDIFMLGVYFGTRLLTSESGDLWKQIVGGTWSKIRLCIGLPFLSAIWVIYKLIPVSLVGIILLFLAFIFYFPIHGLSIKILLPQAWKK